MGFLNCGTGGIKYQFYCQTKGRVFLLCEYKPKIGANPNQGLASVLDTVKNKCDPETAKEILKDIDACYEDRPWLAMVNSAKGITNLHAPNDSKFCC